MRLRNKENQIEFEGMIHGFYSDRSAFLMVLREGQWYIALAKTGRSAVWQPMKEPLDLTVSDRTTQVSFAY